MWGSKKSTYSVKGATTLVSRETTVTGNIQFTGNLDIEGVVQGNIVAQPGKDALVRVLTRGRVEGEIQAPFVVINGAVEGDVHASKQLELASRARVKGSVYYAQVEMAVGSEVNGTMQHMIEKGEAPAKQADPSVKVTEARLPGGQSANSAKVD